MKLKIRKLAVILSIMIYSLLNNIAYADEIYDFIYEQISSQTMVIEKYDEYYTAYIANSGNDEVLIYDLASLKELTDEQAKLGAELTIKQLRILARSDSDYFTSVTYEYDYLANMGNSNIEGSVNGHSVLMRSADTGWVSIFDAVTQ